jgi:hypothetical protein
MCFITLDDDDAYLGLRLMTAVSTNQSHRLVNVFNVIEGHRRLMKKEGNHRILRKKFNKAQYDDDVVSPTVNCHYDTTVA